MLSSHFCTGINELWHEIWRLAPPSTNANAAERLAAAERLSAKRPPPPKQRSGSGSKRKGPAAAARALAPKIVGGPSRRPKLSAPVGYKPRGGSFR